MNVKSMKKSLIKKYKQTKTDYNKLKELLDMELKEKSTTSFKELQEIIIKLLSETTIVTTKKYASTEKEGWMTRIIYEKIKQRNKVNKSMVKNRDSHYLKQQFKIQDRDTKKLLLKRQKENSSKINYKVQRVTVKNCGQSYKILRTKNIYKLMIFENLKVKMELSQLVENRSQLY
ncbi:hypothetical protein HHI36_000624 [Cryptolaemus montrouzieri]|uniref:Uncharacterized protein n=1 Tax=Cryptolaemus montrouzieri TaxID=559131 RepID=A0ABD2P5B5_9CUCU